MKAGRASVGPGRAWLVALAGLAVHAALGVGCGETLTVTDAGPRVVDAGRSDAGRPVGLDAEVPPDAGTAALVLVGSWGGRGVEPGQFIEPSSVELDPDGVVIVAGHEDRVQRFTKDGLLLDIFGTSGGGDGQFNHPHGLAVDRRRDGLIYVGDQENHRLQVFDRQTRFVRQWGDDGFRHIHDVGIDQASGDVFVGDYERHTLRRFTAEGALVFEKGGFGVGPGLFNGVWGISTDAAGDLYVADTHNRRVQKLSADGDYLSEWRGYGDARFEKPTGVFVDEQDVVYVCDALAERVVLFSTEGAVLEVWDLPALVGERTEPEDVVIDPTGRHVYVAEVFGHRVLHFERR